MIYAGILAGGVGTRMGKDIPKQFLKIGDIPIIVRTVRKFLSLDNIDKIIVAINSDWKEFCIDILKKYDLENNVLLVDGGKTRFESLINLSLKANEISDDRDTILITHDCARPFVDTRIIKDNIKNIQFYDAVTTSVPTIDTVLISKDGITSVDVPKRSEIFLDQGPQTFKVREFLDIINSLTEEEKSIYMEAGKLFLDKNKKVGIILGDRRNFKITTDIDLKYAEFLLKEGYLE